MKTTSNYLLGVFFILLGILIMFQITDYNPLLLIPQYEYWFNSLFQKQIDSRIIILIILGVLSLGFIIIVLGCNTIYKKIIKKPTSK